MLQHSKSLFFAQVYIAPPPAWAFFAPPLAHKYTQGLQPHEFLFAEV